MQLNVLQLKQKIDRLRELYDHLMEQFFEQEDTAFSKTVVEYTELKKEILLSLFETPIHKTDQKHFRDVRRVLQRLTLNGDPFLPGKNKMPDYKEAIDALHQDLGIKLTDQENDELAWEHFYSWFSGEQYVEALIKSQLLILRVERIPKELSHFVDEIRSCYAFQNYTAAFSLCRTLLEIAVRDIFESNKLHQYNSKYAKPAVEYFEEKKKGEKITSIEDFDPTLFDRVEILSKLPKFEGEKNNLHDVRILGNSMVHANRVGTKTSATEMIQKTFNVIHNLYEAN